MDYRIEELRGRRMLVVSGNTQPLRRAQDLLDLIGEALHERASMIVVEVAQLDPDFFRLHTGLAGEFVQKIVNYRLRLAIVGDVSVFTASSKAFADFVRESNRGDNVFFVSSMDALTTHGNW